MTTMVGQIGEWRYWPAADLFMRLSVLQNCFSIEQIFFNERDQSCLEGAHSGSEKLSDVSLTLDGNHSE